ncbi:thyroid transcription factor 1-associated protein 26 [Rhinoderma darwinii]|uniref:thyroid transcription factor 1-associated protein 26 n=1 Tax=Rhinoderma darwinii TaxID=43563 RepID=UPI003F67242F
MATTSRKRSRDVGSKGEATFDSGSRLKAKCVREAPGHKTVGINTQKAEDSRGPWKKSAFEGKGSGKRKWRPNQKVFEGSANEGQGFTLWRKKNAQLQYKKLLRKQNKASPKEVSYSDHYPEHLKHLYLAEERRLKSEELRKLEKKRSETVHEEREIIPKKKCKKTSNQKAREEYEQKQRERAKKRIEAENIRRQIEEAKKLYQQKRVETYKVLSSKTKKGQPNFNVQMEYLLKKIESKS